MADVLTTEAKLQCGPVPVPAPPPPSPVHAAIDVKSTAVLTVKGKPVLLKSSLPTVLSACPNPVEAGGPCKSFTLTDGTSTVLKVNNEPVVLATIAATISPNNLFMFVSAGQSILHVKR